jgi:hypothetical protein
MFEQLAARYPKNNGMASALDDCAKGYRELHGHLARIAGDETLTEGGRVISSAKAARNKLMPLLESLDAAMQTAATYAAQLEAQTAAAYQAPANPPYPLVLRHQEIRQFMRGLPQGEKLRLLEAARQAGDEDTLIAIASVQPFLSGVDAQVQNMVRGQLIEAKVPETAGALKSSKEQQEEAARFAAHMAQSMADLIDFQKADELIAAAREDVDAA